MTDLRTLLELGERLAELNAAVARTAHLQVEAELALYQSERAAGKAATDAERTTRAGNALTNDLREQVIELRRDRDITENHLRALYALMRQGAPTNGNGITRDERAEAHA